MRPAGKKWSSRGSNPNLDINSPKHKKPRYNHAKRSKTRILLYPHIKTWILMHERLKNPDNVAPKHQNPEYYCPNILTNLDINSPGIWVL
uniref:Uncharacterized protein n=1 Tax=Amphiprion percula TaxID=161767 RepID=A0A3P8SZY0_AMPPE